MQELSAPATFHAVLPGFGKANSIAEGVSVAVSCRLSNGIWRARSTTGRAGCFPFSMADLPIAGSTLPPSCARFPRSARRRACAPKRPYITFPLRPIKEAFIAAFTCPWLWPKATFDHERSRKLRAVPRESPSRGKECYGNVRFPPWYPVSSGLLDHQHGTGGQPHQALERASHDAVIQR